MKLSKRIYALAAQIEQGESVSDIGTDHAFVPISLVEEGRIPSALAMDVNEGPLERAKEHIVENGYDPVYGARPLKRYIQRTVETAVAKTLIREDVRARDTLVVDCEDGVMQVQIER